MMRSSAMRWSIGPAAGRRTGPAAAAGGQRRTRHVPRCAGPAGTRKRRAVGLSPHLPEPDRAEPAAAAALARVLERAGDRRRSHWHLAEDARTPLAALAPRHVFYVATLSKVISPACALRSCSAQALRTPRRWLRPRHPVDGASAGGGAGQPAAAGWFGAIAAGAGARKHERMHAWRACWRLRCCCAPKACMPGAGYQRHGLTPPWCVPHSCRGWRSRPHRRSARRCSIRTACGCRWGWRPIAGSWKVRCNGLTGCCCRTRCRRSSGSPGMGCADQRSAPHQCRRWPAEDSSARLECADQRSAPDR